MLIIKLEKIALFVDRGESLLAILKESVQVVGEKAVGRLSKMKGSIMKMVCPDCESAFYLFGDFINGEGQIVRAGDIHVSECKKCFAIAKEAGMVINDDC